jgi:hypothetical protein
MSLQRRTSSEMLHLTRAFGVSFPVGSHLFPASAFGALSLPHWQPSAAAFLTASWFPQGRLLPAHAIPRTPQGRRSPVGPFCGVQILPHRILWKLLGNRPLRASEAVCVPTWFPHASYTTASSAPSSPSGH